MKLNDDPVSRLTHPVLLANVASSDLEARRIVGALLLAWSLDLDDNGDAEAALMSRLLGEAIRP
jgi:hypothetical protein